MSMTAWTLRGVGWRGRGMRRRARLGQERGSTVDAALRRLLPEATGQVAEIGADAARHGGLYDRRKVTGIVPIGQAAGCRADTVVSFNALCSAGCIREALADVRDALRPGGRLLFVEQDRADGPRTACWQDRLDPLWAALAGGRHLNRNISRHIENAGFRIEYLDTFRQSGMPALLGRHCVGIARLR